MYFILKILKLTLFGATILLASGCQSSLISSSKGLCQALDWHELGRADGVRGFPSITWEKKAKTCKQFTNKNHRDYVGGWYAGVDRFCRADHAYHYGKTGQTYYRVCTEERDKIFVKNYAQGLKAYRYEASIDRIKKKVKNLELKVELTQSQEQKKTLLEQIQSLKEKQAFQKNEIVRIESQLKSSRFQ